MRVLRVERELGNVGAHAEGRRRLVAGVLPANVRARFAETEHGLGCGVEADVLGALPGLPGGLGKHEVSR